MRIGKHEKLIFRAFRDKKVTDEFVDDFEVPINPDNLAEELQILHERSQSQGAQGNDQRYRGTRPGRLTLNMMFDNTGTVEGNKLDGTPVSEQLAMFHAVVRNMDPKTHKPLYLKINYQQFVFDCVLINLKVQYTLYDSSGSALRAKVTATFEEYKEPVKRVRLEDKQSPDLTHVRQVVEGNNLPLLTYQIYGNTKYYLQVAKINGMTNFRRLNVGSQVVFPAIDKELNG